MDFLKVINDLTRHMDGNHWGINGLFTMPDLSKYQKQPTDMETLPVEYIYQVGDGDYGFSGTIFFPLEYPDGDSGKLFLKIWFE